MNLQRRGLSQIRKYQTRVYNNGKSPLNRLTIIVSQIGKERFNTGDGEEDPAQDVEVFRSDEVVNCFTGIVGTEDCRIICKDVDYSGDEEGSKPEPHARCKEQGNPFRTELLDQELN